MKKSGCFSINTYSCDNKMNRPVYTKLLASDESSCFMQQNNIDKVEIFHVLHSKGEQLTRRGSACGTRNHDQRLFRKV